MSDATTTRVWLERGTVHVDWGHENIVEPGLMVVETDDGNQSLWPALKEQRDLEYLFARTWLILRKKVVRVILYSTDFERYTATSFSRERVVLSGGARV